MSGLRVRVCVRDLTRTGVPVALLRYLRWAVAHTGAVFDVVAEAGGPLAGELAALGVPVVVLEPEGRRSITDAAAVALHVLGAPATGRRARAIGWRRRLRGLPSADVVVVHGLGAWRAGEAARRRGLPYVVHVHELEAAWDRCALPASGRPLLGGAARVLAACAPVAALCVARGADPAVVRVVPPCVEDGPRWPTAGGPPSPARCVVAVGAPGWRKGSDRFVAVAHELGRRRPDVECRWIGGRPEGRERAFVGSADPVRWIESVADPWSEVPDGSVLVVASREDPMPLVVIEAAARGIPVVATATGGLVDLLDGGRGNLVGHDVRELVGAVSGVLEGAVGRAAGVEELRRLVLSEYTASAVAPRWWREVEATAGPRRR